MSRSGALLRALAGLLCVLAAQGEMYDAVFPNHVAAGKCAKNGCAKWSDLAGDGNTRSQRAVNAKWALGRAPDDAGRNCAMPSNDPDMTYWCYCKGSGDASWDYCASPAAPVPEQINIQHTGTHSIAVVSFVTFSEPSLSQGSAPQVRWGSTNSSLDESAQGVTRVYIESGNQHRTYYLHFCKITGLRPRSNVYYQVRSAGSDWSNVMSFRTLYYGVGDGGVTKIGIFGDMGVYKYNNMANLERDAKAGDIDAVIHLGDHAYNIAAADGLRGDGYLNAFQRVIGAAVPWVPVLGNHEYYENDEFHRYLNQTWGEVYGGPSDHTHNTATALNTLLTYSSAIGVGSHGAVAGPASGTSRYYSVDIGLVHFVALDLTVYYFDTEAQYRDAQIKWLEADLTAAQANRESVPWIVLGSHYPIYCSSITLGGAEHDDGQGDEDPGSFKGCWSYGSSIDEVRGDLEPLMARFGVDMYLAGHEHDYESIYPTLNNTVLAKNFTDPPAPVHIVTGAGGAPALDKFGDPGPWTRKQLAEWGYGRITTTNSSVLTYAHVLNSDDSVYDTVSIVKTGGKHEPYPIVF